MSNARIMTLFGDPRASRWRPSSLAISLLLHITISALFFGAGHAPRTSEREIRHFTVRTLRFVADERTHRPSGTGGEAQGGGAGDDRAVQSSAALPSVSSGEVARHSVAAEPSALRAAAQTLVQPDEPLDTPVIAQVRVPVAILWSADPTPTKVIVPSPPQERTVTEALPSIQRPNRVQELADLKIAAALFPTQAPLISASNTSPVVVRGPELIKQIPVTTSRPMELPTPARVVSLSDLKMQTGPIVIPATNQALLTRPDSQQSGETPSPSPSTSESSRGETNSGQKDSGGAKPSNRAETGRGLGRGATGKLAGGNVTGGSGSASGTGSGRGSDSSSGLGASVSAQGGGPGQGTYASFGAGDSDSGGRITLPRDGQFGVVVVGSTLAEQYPETVEVWGSRLVYTVYLHVGSQKKWMLQYSLPKEATTPAVAATRPEPPWAYDMLLPQLAWEESMPEAIMVHGFVNLMGRFERLRIVFPVEFSHARAIFRALEQWQFRPARQNGKLAVVEVLLVIPEQAD